jgi:hypothetical protein
MFDYENENTEEFGIGSIVVDFDDVDRWTEDELEYFAALESE